MTQIHELQHVAHELLYLGADGSPIYTDSFRQLNTEVLQKSDALFALKEKIRKKKHDFAWLS